MTHRKLKVDLNRANCLSYSGFLSFCSYHSRWLSENTSVQIHGLRVKKTWPCVRLNKTFENAVFKPSHLFYMYNAIITFWYYFHTSNSTVQQQTRGLCEKIIKIYMNYVLNWLSFHFTWEHFFPNLIALVLHLIFFQFLGKKL